MSNFAIAKASLERLILSSALDASANIPSSLKMENGQGLTFGPLKDAVKAILAGNATPRQYAGLTSTNNYGTQAAIYKKITPKSKFDPEAYAAIQQAAKLAKADGKKVISDWKSTNAPKIKAFGVKIEKYIDDCIISADCDWNEWGGESLWFDDSSPKTDEEWKKAITEASLSWLKKGTTHRFGMPSSPVYIPRTILVNLGVADGYKKLNDEEDEIYSLSSNLKIK